MGSLGSLISHSPSWRSLTLENPVVAILSSSPNQVTRLFFAPAWPGTTCAAFSWRTSHIRSFLSREVVAINAPLALQDSDWIISVCFSVRRCEPASTSHSLTVKSPEEVAKIFSAAGLKRTCPTFLRVFISKPSAFYCMTAVPRMPNKLWDWCNINGLLALLSANSEIFRDFPYKRLWK